MKCYKCNVSIESIVSEYHAHNKIFCQPCFRVIEREEEQKERAEHKKLLLLRIQMLEQQLQSSKEELAKLDD